MKSWASRRWVWLPLLLLVGAAISCGAAAFRKIGLGELAVILAVFALVFMIESVVFVVKQFWSGYRRK